MSPERHVERFRASVERVRALIALQIEQQTQHPRAAILSRDCGEPRAR